MSCIILLYNNEYVGLVNCHKFVRAEVCVVRVCIKQQHCRIIFKSIIISLCAGIKMLDIIFPQE